MGILAFKIIAFVAILLTGLAGGLLSVRLSASERSDRFFSLGNAFAGGIFLGAGLIHMLPDAQEGLKALASDFPWVMLLCAAGFLLVLVLEKVIIHSHDAVADSVEREAKCSLYPYILTIVLSVHSVIAGIALGTEDTIRLSIVIFIALISHKGSAAFALGVSLVRAGIHKSRLLKIVTLFCFMTPLGIVIGSIATAAMSGRTEQIVEGVFDAVAAGTFLYVAVLAIIEEEFSLPHDRWLKFFLLTFGLGVMAVLAIWA